MPISTTSSVHWRWNENDVSQFGSQINLGPVTGTVTITRKPATGTFMINPTIRMSLSNGFHTPSGSIALIPIDIDELPKNFGVRFYVNHFSASNNVMSNRNNVATFLRWGFVLNASSGTNESDYCGIFYSVPFEEDATIAPLPLNGGRLNRGGTAGTLIATRRLGMITSSYCYHNWWLKHLSLTGSFYGGSDVEVQTHFIPPRNYSYFLTQFDSNDINYSAIHWSGSAFSQKILTKAFLGFWYDPASFDTTPISGVYVEIDSLQFLKHPAGNGQEFQPPPLTMSLYSGTLEPISFSSTLTYWAQPTASLLTISGSKVLRFGNFSGSIHNFGNSFATAPLTSSLIINSQSYPTILFSGGLFLTSSAPNNGAFLSASSYRIYYVLNIVTGVLNSTTRYSNHPIQGDSSGWWGVYYRNNGNGSGTLDAFTWDSTQRTASVPFKFGETILFESWRDSNFIYAKLNNQTISSGAVTGNTSVNSSIGTLNNSNINAQWHLVEMVLTNANSQEDINTVGVANYLASKYGLPTISSSVAIGGEIW
jgi:hypothetical protein